MWGYLSPLAHRKQRVLSNANARGLRLVGDYRHVNKRDPHCNSTLSLINQVTFVSYFTSVDLCFKMPDLIDFYMY